MPFALSGFSATPSELAGIFGALSQGRPQKQANPGLKDGTPLGWTVKTSAVLFEQILQFLRQERLDFPRHQSEHYGRQAVMKKSTSFA